MSKKNSYLLFYFTGASSSNLAASNVDASGEAVSSAAAMVKDPNVISTEEELFRYFIFS